MDLLTKTIFWSTNNEEIYFAFFCYHNNKFCLHRAGPRPHIPFPPDLILYVNLVAKFFKTLAPRLTVLDIPYFADPYSRTVRPIDLHNF